MANSHLFLLFQCHFERHSVNSFFKGYFNLLVHHLRVCLELQTYHSLKLGGSPSLCADVFCTADLGVFVGSSVFAETSTGGVEDSYPELAAGDDSEPCDSCTLNYNVHRCMTYRQDEEMTRLYTVKRYARISDLCYTFVNQNTEQYQACLKRM